MSRAVRVALGVGPGRLDQSERQRRADVGGGDRRTADDGDGALDQRLLRNRVATTPAITAKNGPWWRASHRTAAPLQPRAATRGVRHPDNVLPRRSAVVFRLVSRKSL